MLFNSYSFLVFSALFYPIFFLLSKYLRLPFILAASAFFYYSFIPSYLALLLTIITADFFIAILIEKNHRFKKLLLILSILFNIGTLSFFKYSDFTFSIINHTINSNISPLNLILPIGLSFHTFQSLSYIIEIYRGNYKAETNMIVYASYVLFFPQLVAGPIERPNQLLPQLKNKIAPTGTDIHDGIRLIIWGLFKKVVIADRLAQYVDIVYQNPSEFHWLNIFIATIYFSIQLYCDFSGYSDMAIGLSRLMGIRLMINFNRPFKTSTIRDLWNNWHISLTSWFRDYIYIPLGGNRKGFLRKLINIILVFFLSGLWHGANYTFILFGLSNGCLIVLYLVAQKMKIIKKRVDFLPPTLRLLFNFILFSFTCIFFRAKDLNQAFKVFSGIFNLQQPSHFTFNITKQFWNHTMIWGNTIQFFTIFFLLILFIVEFRNTPLLTEFNFKKRKNLILLTIIVSSIIFFGIFQKRSFIYFQF